MAEVTIAVAVDVVVNMTKQAKATYLGPKALVGALESLPSRPQEKIATDDEAKPCCKAEGRRTERVVTHGDLPCTGS
jgi:hypothetical protein